MTLPNSTQQRMSDQFVEDANGKVAVRTLPTGGATSAKQDDILTELGQKTEPSDTQKVEEQEVVPTNGSKNNPSYALTYTSDELTQLDMTIGGTTFRRTLTWTDHAVTAISNWSEV